MRVLIVSHEFPPCVWGGVGVYVTNLVRELMGRVQFRVLCLDGASPFGAALGIPPVPVERVTLRARRWPLLHLEFFLRANHYVRARAAEFDLVHDHTSRVTGGSRPVVTTVHGTEEQERAVLAAPSPCSPRDGLLHGGLALLAGLERIALARTDVMATVSRAMVRHLHRRYGPREIVLARCAVDRSRFRPGPEAADVDVLFVGRFQVRKGLPELLAALDRLPGPLRVLFCGSYGDRSMGRGFREWAGRTTHRVEVRTDVGHVEMPSIYRRSRLLATPSRYEPFGTVVAEALACGTPAVVSTANGLPELVRDGVNGRVVGVGDVAGLAGAIGSVLASEPERLRMARRAAADTGGLSWAGTAENTLRAYRRALRPHQCAGTAAGAPREPVRPPVLPR